MSHNTFVKEEIIMHMNMRLKHAMNRNIMYTFRPNWFYFIHIHAKSELGYPVRCVTSMSHTSIRESHDLHTDGSLCSSKMTKAFSAKTNGRQVEDSCGMP